MSDNAAKTHAFPLRLSTEHLVRKNNIPYINRYTTERPLRASGFFALEFLRSRAERLFVQIKNSLDIDRDIIKIYLKIYLRFI